MNIVHHNTRKYQALIARLRQERPSLLLGSAVSIFSPTSLQSGESVTTELSRAFCAAAKVGGHFYDLVSQSAFEVIIQNYPKPEIIYDLLEEYFHGANSIGNLKGNVNTNKIHRAIANSARRNYINNILTTNYDCCIERAFIEENISNLNVIINKRDRLNRSAINFFKIHGSAHIHGSAIFTMLQEHSMKNWKRKKFSSVIGENLITIGYSGRDFEICPEIYDLKLERLIWIARPILSGKKLPELTENAKRILNNCKSSIVLCVDLRDFLTDFSGFDCKSDSVGQTSTKTLSDLLISNLSDSDMRLWAGRVFNDLGAPAATINILKIEELFGKLSYEFSLLRCGILNHTGKFLDAANENARLSLYPNISLKTQIDRKISESGSASMGGFNERAASALDDASRLAAHIIDKDERIFSENGIEWMKLVLLRGSLNRSQRKDVAQLIGRLQALYNRAIENGAYGLAGLCSNEIKELEGDSARSHKKKKFNRDANEIFNQMGSFLGQVTAARDRLRRTMSNKEANKLKKSVNKLSEFKLVPELWRVLYTLIHFEKSRRKRVKLQQEVEHLIGSCQFDIFYVNQMMEDTRSAVSCPKGVSDGNSG